jgi:hypothetical protein
MISEKLPAKVLKGSSDIICGGTVAFNCVTGRT